MILVVVMLLGILPLGMFSAFAATAAPTALPDGTTQYRTVNYFNGEAVELAAECVPNATKNALWRGADGLMIKVTAGADGANIVPQFMLNMGQSSNVASYVRGSIACPEMPAAVSGYVTSTVYLWNGTAWSTQQTDNVGTEDMADAVVLPANFDGYVYIPMDQFWFFGPGNRASITEDTNPYLFQTKFVDYIAQAQKQVASVNVALRSGAGTVAAIDYVYAINDWAPKATDVYEPIVVTDCSATSASSGSVASGAWDGNATTTLTDVQTANNTGTLIWQSLTSTTYDLSDVKGIQVDVDTTAVGANGQVHFRLFFQRKDGATNGVYASGQILGAYNTTANGIYETNGNTSYMQYVTRSVDSVAYIKDAQGNWEPVYAEGTNYTANSESAFALPANYKGPVYIPMDSYYLTLVNNSSETMIAWDDCLLQSAGAIGYSPWISGTAAATKITVSNYQFVYEAPSADTVTLDNADEVLAFFNDPASFSGKNVVLTTDVTFNAGWDAFAETVTAPTTVLAPTSNTFAGTFDGQGHTISGLFLAATANNAGFFGNVATGTTATVKNLVIKNSYLSNTAGATGGIFGTVMAESTTAITNPHYVNTTKAYIDGVLLDVNIVNTGNKTGTEGGVGGFIGHCMADADIRNSIFAGTVTSNTRGTAAMIGDVYVQQGTVGDVGSVNLYRMDINLHNNVFTGTLNASGQGFVGAIAGYFNPNTVFMKVDRFYSYGAVNSSASGKKDGILFGGGWCAEQVGTRDGVSTDKSYVILTNITYVVAGDVTKIMDTVSHGFGAKVYVNGSFYQFKGGDDITEAQLPATAAADAAKFVIREALQWKQQVTLTEQGTFEVTYYLKSSAIVPVGTTSTLQMKVRYGGSGTTLATTLDAALTEDGMYYYATFPVGLERFNVEFKLEAVVGTTVKVAEAKTDVRPNMKNYMMTIINGDYSDEMKALAGDVLRYADLGCDEYMENPEAVDLAKLATVLTDGEADTLPGSTLMTAPVIEGTHFTAMAYDDETGKFTITADANSGACSATFGGEAVALTLEADGSLSFTLPEDATYFDMAKTLVVTNGTSTISGSMACFMPNDTPASVAALLALYTSAVACL